MYDCPICKQDYDLRVQHEMHRGFTPAGLKGGQAGFDEENVDADSDENEDSKLFERQY